ncbi:hypothetical protein V8C44DRAFT_129975 [Trichoderma aethiopicum]
MCPGALGHQLAWSITTATLSYHVQHALASREAYLLAMWWAGYNESLSKVACGRNTLSLIFSLFSFLSFSFSFVLFLLFKLQWGLGGLGNGQNDASFAFPVTTCTYVGTDQIEKEGEMIYTINFLMMMTMTGSRCFLVNGRAGSVSSSAEHGGTQKGDSFCRLPLFASPIPVLFFSQTSMITMEIPFAGGLLGRLQESWRGGNKRVDWTGLMVCWSGESAMLRAP